MIQFLQIKDDRGAKLISTPAEVLDHRGRGAKGCFAEMEGRFGRHSVGRPDKILPTVTLRGALSFFSIPKDWKRLQLYAVVVFVFEMKGRESP